MNASLGAQFAVTVVARQEPCADVAVLELEAVAGELPRWEPGAHIDVLVGSAGASSGAVAGEPVRQYSLCGDQADTRRWRIGVLRETDGRGGSAWLSDEVRFGSVLRVAGPRSHFSFDAAAAAAAGEPVLFIAGGIGVTPILPMAAAAASAGVDYALHYAGHEGRMAFVDELRERHGERLTLHLSEAGERLELRALLGSAAPSTRVVCCGPLRLIDEAEALAAEFGLDFAAERFVAEAQPEPLRSGPFEVELASSGLTLEVPEGRSILEVVEEAGVFALSSCHEGTCGSCETPVLAGEVDHRDSILTPAERARNDVMYICVSRAACPKLTLEL